MQALRFVLVIIAGYLMGAFPTGYVIARLWKGVDPRNHGSGRTGGTNVLRAAGRWPAVLTVLGDLLKGLGATLLANLVVGTEPAAAVAGVAAVLGHNHSVFLGFRGGAGSMTNAGVILGLAPHVVPLMGAAALVAALLSRTASVVSIAAALMMVVALVASFFLSLAPMAYVVYGVLACTLILFELRPNIQRLATGAEHRVERY